MKHARDLRVQYLAVVVLLFLAQPMVPVFPGPLPFKLHFEETAGKHPPQAREKNCSFQLIIILHKRLEPVVVPGRRNPEALVRVQHAADCREIFVKIWRKPQIVFDNDNGGTVLVYTVEKVPKGPLVMGRNLDRAVFVNAQYFPTASSRYLFML